VLLASNGIVLPNGTAAITIDLIQRVSEHSLAAQSRAPLRPGAQRIDRVGDDDQDPRPIGRQGIEQRGQDPCVVGQVDHPRLGDGQGHRGADAAAGTRDHDPQTTTWASAERAAK
jgi:hypothetical protein